MRSADDAFISLLAKAMGEAVSEGFPLRLVLRGGEVVEGVPEEASGDFRNAPSALTPESEHDEYGPPEFTVTIGGTEVLAQEVEEFAVRRR